MRKIKEKILLLYKQGKSYTEIANELKCSKSVISYHCNKDCKIKYRNYLRKRRQKLHPFKMKLYNFMSRKYKKPITKKQVSSWRQILYLKIRLFCSKNKKGGQMASNMTFTADDVINKFGETPTCYITGDEIDIYNTKSYQFDHIIPASRGGDNSLDNLGICTKRANLMKGDMTPNELYSLCSKITDYQKSLRNGN